jgi:hypothetical protein
MHEAPPERPCEPGDGHRRGARDDRVLVETRVTSLIVVCVLLPAVVILWGLPARTADLWAWWITPDLTPIFIGSAYGPGGVLLRAGLRSPALASGLRRRAGCNRVRDPHAHRHARPLGPPQPRRRPPSRGRGLLRVGGRVRDRPSPGRGSLAAQPANRPPGASARRTPCSARHSARRQSLCRGRFLVASALLLVGAARAFGDFDPDNPLTWCYLGGVLGTVLGLLVLYRRMERPGHGRPITAPFRSARSLPTPGCLAALLAGCRLVTSRAARPRGCRIGGPVRPDGDARAFEQLDRRSEGHRGPRPTPPRSTETRLARGGLPPHSGGGIRTHDLRVMRSACRRRSRWSRL